MICTMKETELCKQDGEFWKSGSNLHARSELTSVKG